MNIKLGKGKRIATMTATEQRQVVAVAAIVNEMRALMGPDHPMKNEAQCTANFLAALPAAAGQEFDLNAKETSP